MQSATVIHCGTTKYPLFKITLKMVATHATVLYPNRICFGIYAQMKLAVLVDAKFA